MSKKKDALDALRGNAPIESDAPIEEPQHGTAYLVYFGRTGPEEEFDHHGSHCEIATGHKPLLLRPGLNPIDADLWAAYKSREVVDGVLTAPALVDKGWISETTADLRGWSSPEKRRKLAEHSTSPEGLEHLVRLEKARPVTASRTKRRDADLLAKLEKRLAAYARQAPMVLDDIHKLASHRTATAPRPRA